MKRPWMPLYIADYLADTAHLSTIEHGAYILLIMHYWTKGSLPSDDDTVRRITRLDKRQWVAHRDILASMFLPGWRHKRINSELAKAIEKSKANSANAHKRHAERSTNAERSDTQSQLQLQKEERKKDGAEAPIELSQKAPDAKVFSRCREVLKKDKDAGWIARRLLEVKGNIPGAMSAIEMADGKDDPKTYLLAMVKKRQTITGDADVVWRDNLV